MKKLRDSKLFTTMLFTIVLCLAILCLVLYPENNMRTENTSTISVDNEISRAAISNNVGNKRNNKPTALPMMTADTYNRQVSQNSVVDVAALKEGHNEELMLPPSGSGGYVIRNSDGTNTITKDVELELGDDVVFRFPKGTIVEKDGIIRVGPQGAQLVDAAGNVRNFPPGHALGFSYVDENTSDDIVEAGSFDILGTVEKQRSDTGCNNGITANIPVFVLWLFLEININRKRKDTML